MSIGTDRPRERPRPFADEWSSPGTPRPPSTIANPLGAAGRIEPAPLRRPSLGAHYRRFAADEIAAVASVDGEGGIDLSGDGSEVVFAWDRSGEWEIYTAPLSGDRIIQLTEARAISRSPRWSPDASWIAFLRSDEAGRSAIWLVDRDGERERRLTPADAAYREHAWSPDGTHLVAVAANGDLHVIDAASGEARRIARGSQPCWSRDGASILFTVAIDGARTDLAVVAASGGEPRLLGTADRDGSSRDGSWAPDGRTIAFTTTVRGRREVAFARFRDGSVVNVEHLGATPFDAAEPVWRPDARGVVYRRWADGSVSLRRAFTVSHADEAVSDVPGVHFSPHLAPDSETAIAVLSSATRSADVIVRSKGAVEIARVTSSLAGVIDPASFIEPIAMGAALAYLPALEAAADPPKVVVVLAAPERSWDPVAQLLSSHGRTVIRVAASDASAAVATVEREGLGDGQDIVVVGDPLDADRMKRDLAGRTVRSSALAADLTYAKRTERARLYDALVTGVEGHNTGG